MQVKSPLDKLQHQLKEPVIKFERVNFGDNHGSIKVIRKDILSNGMPRTMYQAFLHEEPFPRLFDNVSFHDHCITIFSFTGNVYVGDPKSLSFDLVSQSNGVLRGEIRVIDHSVQG